MTAYLIMTGCEHGPAYANHDQIVETLAIAQREASDLLRLGCGQIRIYEFASADLAEEYHCYDGPPRWPKPAKLVSTRNPRD